MVFEVIGRALSISRMKGHLAPRALIFSGSAGNCYNGILPVIEGSGDRDLSVLQEQRPETLPGLAGDSADAPAIVGSDLVLVFGIVNVISKRQNITGTVAFSSGVEYRVRCCSFHESEILRMSGARGKEERTDTCA